MITFPASFLPAVFSLSGGAVQFVARPNEVDGATSWAFVYFAPDTVISLQRAGAVALTFAAAFSLLRAIALGGTGDAASIATVAALFTGWSLCAASVFFAVRRREPASDALWVWVIAGSVSEVVGAIAASSTGASIATVRTLGAVAAALALGAAAALLTPAALCLRAHAGGASPLDRATFFARLAWTWMSPLIALGARRPLQADDLPRVPQTDAADSVKEVLSVAWAREAAARSRPKAPLFLRVLARGWGGIAGSALVYKLSFDTAQAAGPLLLSRILSWLSATIADTDGSGAPPFDEGLQLVGLLFLVQLVQTLLLHQYFARVFRLGMSLRSATIVAVFDKSLRLSSVSGGGDSVAAINAVSSDAKRLQDVCTYVTSVVSAPYQIALYTTLLYFQVGAAVFAGIAVMVLALPFNGLLATLGKNLQEKLMKLRDARVGATAEALSTIRLIKSCAWEAAFCDHIRSLRALELRTLWLYRLSQAAGEVTWLGLPVLVALATFGTHALQGGVLSPQIVFTALALFNLLRFPLAMLPSTVSSAVEAGVSLKRIQLYLDQEEVMDGAVENDDVDAPHGATESSADARSDAGMSLLSQAQASIDETVLEVSGTGALGYEDCRRPISSNGASIVFRDAVFSWSPKISSEAPFLLRNLSFSVPRGALCAVIGPTGSGKSALCAALLGETWRTGGRAIVRGNFGYAPQTAFIRNASLRENILFGSPYDRDRYNRVLAAAALLLDISTLPGGDETEIGERGITLSGGQRARVGFARALYSRAPCLLFDDPLSAVDAHVGSHMLQSICAENRTRVLVTHSLAALPACDLILVLDRGTLVQVGSSADVLAAPCGTLAALLNASAGSARIASDSGGSANAPARVAASVVAESPVASSGGRQMTREGRSEGAVAFSISALYADALGGRALVAALLLSFITFNAISLGTTFFLSFWASGVSGLSVGQGLGGYAGLTVLSLLVLALQSVATTAAGQRAAATLHGRLIDTLLRLPLSFFDTTPAGRVINRIAGDVATLDGPLPEALVGLASTALNVLASLATAVIATPAFAIGLAPLLVAYAFVRRYYVRTSRELQRLESLSRSPLLSLLGETTAGISVVRAFRGARAAAAELRARLDDNQKAYFATTNANRWLACRTETLSSALTASAALVAVVSARGAGAYFTSFAGLAISTVLGLSQSLNWAVRMSADVESSLVAVERVAEYSAFAVEARVAPAPSVEQSRTWELAQPESWPSAGALEFRNLRMRYRKDSPEILRGVSFSIPGGSRVGVCGRTAAGKSSLVAALFRTADVIEGDDGGVFIDGVPTARVPLPQLRAALSLVPQDAALFMGTVRRNLDPLHLSSDEKVWAAIDAVGLRAGVQSLEAPVAEGGGNFSAGERQLLCFARALLRKSRIVVLDEATASVDAAGDASVHAAVLKAFEGITIISIAHRVETIISSDLIIVMDQGRVVECAPPAVLLEDEGSAFSALVRESSHVSATAGGVAV